tara:strand:- start:36 stop:296 length:261 start_codon:yes stop_codon:yes gene_type:complete
VALQIEQVVDGGMGGCKPLQTLHSPELEHCSLSSSERKMRVLCSVVRPAFGDLALRVAGHAVGEMEEFPLKVSISGGGRVIYGHPN